MYLAYINYFTCSWLARFILSHFLRCVGIKCLILITTILFLLNLLCKYITQIEIAKVKKANPSIDHKEAFKRATGNWKASPNNKNLGKGGGSVVPQIERDSHYNYDRNRAHLITISHQWLTPNKDDCEAAHPDRTTNISLWKIFLGKNIQAKKQKVVLFG